MRILVAEDDRRMAMLLTQGLTEEGHSVVTAMNGRDALSFAAAASFDLILLDVMLPVLDGFAVTRRLRLSDDRTPILMLTAKDTAGDMITGLDLGADDYLTKPFLFDVLFARVRAVGRRGPIARPVSFQLADLTLNTSTREVRRGTRSLSLTKTEFSILELLFRNAGRVIQRDVLIGSVWGDTDIEKNTVDAFLHLLRSKVEHQGEAKLIHTVRGVGYSLRLDE